MFIVVATMLPVLTSAPFPKTTPFGLIKITVPFAFTAPLIIDFVAPFTRLRVEDDELG